MGYEAFTNARDASLRNLDGSLNALDEGLTARRNRNAGNALATGDYSGAANVQFQGGNLQDGMAIQNAGRAREASQRTIRLADEDRVKATLLAGGQGLLRLPEDQWLPTFQSRIAPALLGVGFDQGMIDQISADGITRQELESLVVTLGGEVESPYANDRSGPNGSVLRPGADGAYAPVYTAPVDPLDQEYRRAQIESLRAQQRQREAAADRSRRPPAGRSSGTPWENYR